MDLPDDRQAIEINGSLRRRRTWAVMLPSMKLDLWERVFSQVQGVDNDEPTSYGEGMVGPDSDKWLEAMKSG